MTIPVMLVASVAFIYMVVDSLKATHNTVHRNATVATQPPKNIHFEKVAQSIDRNMLIQKMNKVR